MSKTWTTHTHTCAHTLTYTLISYKLCSSGSVVTEIGTPGICLKQQAQHLEKNKKKKQAQQSQSSYRQLHWSSSRRDALTCLWYHSSIHFLNAGLPIPVDCGWKAGYAVDGSLICNWATHDVIFCEYYFTSTWLNVNTTAANLFVFVYVISMMSCLCLFLYYLKCRHPYKEKSVTLTYTLHQSFWDNNDKIFHVFTRNAAQLVLSSKCVISRKLKLEGKRRNKVKCTYY